VVAGAHPEDGWNWGWQFRAACRGADSTLFFAPNYFEKRHEKELREAQAKAYCRRCPVREECLEYALSNGEKFGIWGGMSERERRRIRRARALARRQGGAASA
jgi:WhiB family redox-sensing transcriptional regulator